MKYVSRIFVWLFVSAMCLSVSQCPNMSDAKNFFGMSSDGKLPTKERKEVRRRLNKSLSEVAERTANAPGSSSFNTMMESNALFTHIGEGEPGKAATEALLQDKEKGFGFNCEEKPTDVKRYQKALTDFKHNSNLVGMVLNMKAYKDIRAHEEGLKAIPVDIARKSFLNAYGDPQKSLVLPHDTKKALGEIKKKHEKLETLKAALSEITFDTEVIEERRDAALSALDDYEAIEVADDIEVLTGAGLDKKFKNSVVKKKLTSVRSMLKFGNQLKSGSKGVAAVKQRIEDIRAKVVELETKTQAQYNELVDTAYKTSGNMDDEYVKDFFSKDHQDLMDRSIEVTGWDFDVDQKFDLMANVIEAKPEVDAEAVFAEMKKLSSDPTRSGAASSKALAFFEDYSALESFKGKQFFEKTFGAQFAELESTLDVSEDKIGEVSSYRRFMSLLCEGDADDCNVSDILSESYRDDKMFNDVFSGLGDMAGVDQNSFEHMENRLASIENARALLVSKFPNCSNALTDATLTDSLQVSREDYIKCDLLDGVMSTSGYAQLCGGTDRGLAGSRASTIVKPDTSVISTHPSKVKVETKATE